MTGNATVSGVLATTPGLAGPILEVEGLRQRLWDPERREEFVVTVEMRIAIHAGHFVSLLGPSGCGKTTLLTVLGLLRKVSDPAGLKHFTITVAEAGHEQQLDVREIWLRNDRRSVERLRRRHIGFALQSGELHPALTVRENIATPLLLNGMSSVSCSARVQELIRAFGLDRGIDRRDIEMPRGSLRGRFLGPGWARRSPPTLASSRVNRLSGGEYQRVALARSIAHEPALVFVDEPTASLNRDLARKALRQLHSLTEKSRGRSAVVMITHDEGLAKEFSNLIVRMEPVKGKSAGRVIRSEMNDPTLANRGLSDG